MNTRTGQIESNWAIGFTRLGGITVRQNLAVVADDPGLIASPQQTGKGAAYVLGVVVPRIVTGPTMADGSAAPDRTITNDSTPTFTIAVDSQVSLQCAFDNTGWAACSPGSVTAPSALADGAHKFGVRTGSGGTPVEHAFTVDTTPPPAPVVRTPAPASTIGGSFVLDFSAEANSTVRCALDAAASSAGTVCTSGQAMSIATAGEHTLRLTATDRVGNVSEPRISTFTVDLTAPTPVISSPAADGQTLVGTATFTFSAGSAAGLTYRCRVDAQAFEACTSPRSYTGLTAGAHSFTVEARNALGNTATATRGFQFVVPDTTAPIVTVSPAGGTFDAGQQIVLSTNEAATIYYTTDGAAPSTASPQYTAPIVLSANFTLRYYAVDTAGNASAAASQNYVVRVVPPPSGVPHDYDADGHADVVALNGSGSMWLYRGDGTGGWIDWRVMFSGAGDVTAIITPGDFSGDGRPDLLTTTSAGQLRLHRGDGAGGMGAAEVIATGWGGLSMPFSPGDWDGDGRTDLLARDSSGRLMLYPGTGTGGIGTARQVGSGWNVMTAIFGPGDFDGDGRADVLARDGSGRLLLYPGDGAGGWRATRQVGSGWTIMTAIVGPGDFDGDGRVDVLARDGSGRLLLYPGNGSGGWRTVRQVGSGWNGMVVIA